MLNILVAGATGKTGSATVKALSAGGKANVRAMVRDTNKDSAKALAGLKNVTLVKGDFTDEASLKAAAKGQERAFLVCSPGSPTQSTNEINFIKACQAENVQLIVRISTCKPLISTETKCVYAAAHARIENYVEESKAPVVDLNPDWFMDNWGLAATEAKANGTVSQPYGDMPKHGFIHSEDIGGYSAALLTIPKDQIAQHIGKRYDICGPEQVTWDDVLAALSKEAGYSIKKNEIKREELEAALKGAGFPDIMALAFSITFAIMEGTMDRYRPMPATAPEMAALYQPKVTVAEQAKRLAPIFKKA